MNALSGLKASESHNIIGLGLTLTVLLVLFFVIDIERIQSLVARTGVWAPVALVLLKASTIVIAPLGGSPLYPLSGLLFGFWPGLLYIEIGDFLGYSIAFWISRIFGTKFVARMLSDKEESMLARVIEHAGTPRGFLHTALTLFALPEALAYGAGLTRLSYVSFIAIIVPITAIGAILFVFIGSLLEAGHSYLIGLALPALGVIAILIGGTLFRRSIIKPK